MATTSQKLAKKEGWPAEYLKNKETTEAPAQWFQESGGGRVQVAYGTDSGVPLRVERQTTPLHGEIWNDTHAGLQSATIEAARLLKWEDKVG